MITNHRKYQLRKEVVGFARQVLTLTADSCESAAPSVANDAEDEYAREYLKEFAEGLVAPVFPVAPVRRKA